MFLAETELKIDRYNYVDNHARIWIPLEDSPPVVEVV